MSEESCLWRGVERARNTSGREKVGKNTNLIREKEQCSVKEHVKEEVPAYSHDEDVHKRKRKVVMEVE